MLTPQQVQETTLERAVFGGYTLESVDDFLEPLTEDYITLYKENAVLKSKMRVLVDKLEEYREQEAAIARAEEEAQRNCEQMIAEAEKKCAAMLREAQSQVKATTNVDAAVAAEEERLNRAKQTASDFIAAVEAEIQKQTEALQALKRMDLENDHSVANDKRNRQRKAFDYEEAERRKKNRAERRAAAQAKENAAKNLEPDADIADEIKSSLEKLVGIDDAQLAPKPITNDQMGDTKKMEPIRKEKYTDLQFGKNYNSKKMSKR